MIVEVDGLGVQCLYAFELVKGGVNDGIGIFASFLVLLFGVAIDRGLTGSWSSLARLLVVLQSSCLSPASSCVVALRLRGLEVEPSISYS